MASGLSSGRPPASKALVPSAILGPGGTFSAILPGWTPRPSQMALADAVRDALGAGRHLVVEAPTGVGKTLGYLVPAAIAGRRVIVSTHTKTLQDQLIDKDLPRLAVALGALGVDVGPARGAPPVGGMAPSGPGSTYVRFALMKGRSNYLCLERLHRRTRQRSLPLLGAEAGGREASEGDLLLEIEAWARTSERGDRAELPGLPERSSLWDALDARSEVCHGTRCPRYGECFVTRMREEGDTADLVVVNHHLLLSDLALRARGELAGDEARFGRVLPDADFLIVDEAHALEGIAAEHFGGSLGFSKIERLARDVGAFAAEQVMLRDSSRLMQAAAKARAAASAAFHELPRAEGRAPIISLEPRLAGFLAAGAHAAAALGALSERLAEEAVLEPMADGLARRAAECRDALRFVLEAEDPDYVYWSEGQGESGQVGASPVEVARLLERFLFERFEAVVLTSATLSAGTDRCAYYKRAIGVPEHRSKTLVLESAFDYARQAALVVPKDAPEPDTPGAEGRMAEIAERAILSVGGGALFLFTSHRGMKAMFRRLAPRLPYPCLVQGEKPKRALLADLVDRAPAVLFATQSFWEGVDIPGDPLRLVLIDRLPFDVPTDPLVRARARRLEASGRSPFAHDQLPRAILRLKQAFGRLIRSHDDRGAVVLLDGRVTKRAYGTRFVDALPPAQRLDSVEDLGRWWQEVPRAPPGLARRGDGE